MTKYCFIRDTLPNDFGEEYELETGSVLTEIVIPVFVSPPYSMQSACGQSNFAQDVFLKRDMEKAVKLVGKVMAPAAHEHIFWSGVMFYHLNKSPRKAEEEIEDVKVVSKGKKKNVSEVLKAEDQVLLYTKRHGSIILSFVEKYSSTRRFWRR